MVQLIDVNNEWFNLKEFVMESGVLEIKKVLILI